MNALEVKAHPHGGFAIARPVERFGSTARIYEGHFTSKEDARSSPLFKTLLEHRPEPTTENHQAVAARWFALSSKMVQRADGYRALAVGCSTDYAAWSRWMRRAVRAQLAVARLIRWGDAAQFRAMKGKLA